MQVKFLVTAGLLHSLRIVLVPLAEGEKRGREGRTRILKKRGKGLNACMHAHTCTHNLHLEIHTECRVSHLTSSSGS